MATVPAIIVIVSCLLFFHKPGVFPLSSGAAADTLLREEYTFGSFRSASRLALSTQGTIVVTDPGAHAVFLYRSPRQQPLSVGAYGWGTTSFDTPSGAATDGLTLYVSDYNNHRIQRFDRTLHYLSTFSTRDTSFSDARFGFPAGVALSRLGDLFILDSENVRVLKFSRTLQLERTFGSIETKDGKLRKPAKLIVTPKDNVYVLDEDRIVEFDYFGNFVRSIGEGFLKNPRGFDVGEQGIVAVSEDALQWFSLRGRLQYVLPMTTILSSVPLAGLQDVACMDDTLYLLTPKEIVVMTLVRTNSE